MFTCSDRVTLALQQSFLHNPVLVIGDVMLDTYIRGDVRRISPEAPVPIVRLQRRESTSGGAANVAANLASVGMAPVLIGVTGNDTDGLALRSVLAGTDLDTRWLLTDSARPTTTKTRVIGAHQQMLRIDVEDPSPINGALEQQICEAISECVQKVKPRSIVLSDYGKGVLVRGVCQHAIATAKLNEIPLLVDPKGLDYSKYSGATTITPNATELAAVSGCRDDDTPALVHAASRLRKALDLQFVTCTRGERGIMLIQQHEITHMPTDAKEVFDVSGAGDTCIAVLAAALGAMLLPVDGVRLANLAAGIAVGKLGTAKVTLEELRAAVERTRYPCGANAHPHIPEAVSLRKLLPADAVPRSELARDPWATHKPCCIVDPTETAHANDKQK